MTDSRIGEGKAKMCAYLLQDKIRNKLKSERKQRRS